MDPDSVPSVGRAVHGGTTDRDLIDFSANTNPEQPPEIQTVYESAFDDTRSYPQDPPIEFQRAAAEYVGCDNSAVIATAGGMAAIRLGFSVTVAPGDSVVIPTPSFSEYGRETQLHGATPVFIPEDEILDIEPENHSLVVLCHPNNPTGRVYDNDRLRAFVADCRATDTTVLLDEAFLDFTDRPSLAGTPGVIVARSLTKMFGIPGLRIGFAVATGDLRDALQTARLPWNLSTPGVVVGTYCLNQHAFVTETKDRVQSERARMREALAEQFTVHTGGGPYLLLEMPDRNIDAVLARTRNAGFAIRDARTFRGFDHHVRIAVRRPEENDAVLAVLRDV